MIKQVRVFGTLAISLLLVASPLAAQDWATYQCTDTNDRFCDIRFLARPVVADDLNAHCPQHDASVFLQQYSAILIVIQDTTAYGARRFYLVSSKTHRTTEDPGFKLEGGEFIRPLWDDPILAVRFPCYVQKLIGPRFFLTDRGFTFTSGTALFLVPLPKTTGRGTLILPLVIVSFLGRFHTVSLSLVLP